MDAFPEGTWQFYVEYALREDTARHATETRGFDSLLNQHHVRLSPADRITAWVMAALHLLHQYDDLLENEWRERVYTTILREVTRREPTAARYAQPYRDWDKQRPSGRGSDSTGVYRKFACSRAQACGSASIYKSRFARAPR